MIPDDHAIDFGADRRAVSTALSFVLSLTITTILVAGLLVAGGDFVDAERNRIVASQLDVVGEQAASGLERAARLNATLDGGEARVRIRLPDTVGKADYDVTVTRGAIRSDGPNEYVVTVTSDSPRVERTTRISVHGEIAEGTVDGGDLVVVADGDGEMEVRNG